MSLDINQWLKDKNIQLGNGRYPGPPVLSNNEPLLSSGNQAEQAFAGLFLAIDPQILLNTGRVLNKLAGIDLEGKMFESIPFMESLLYRLEFLRSYTLLFAPEGQEINYSRLTQSQQELLSKYSGIEICARRLSFRLFFENSDNEIGERLLAQFQNEDNIENLLMFLAMHYVRLEAAGRDEDMAKALDIFMSIFTQHVGFSLDVESQGIYLVFAELGNIRLFRRFIEALRSENHFAVASVQYVLMNFNSYHLAEDRATFYRNLPGIIDALEVASVSSDPENQKRAIRLLNYVQKVLGLSDN